MKEDKTFVKMTAILALAILESTALLVGLDGQIFTVVVAAIAGLAGYEIGKKV